MARLGVRPLSTPHGLRLLDAAARHGASYVVAADVGARPGDGLPAVFRAVAAAAGHAPRAAAGTASAPVDWAGRLAGLTAPEQERLLLDLVRASAATVLGHADPRAVRADAPFKDLGFDSLTSVELRNRLNAATGLRLPATLVFRYPTPAAVAGHLRAELGPEPGSGDPVGQVATGLGGPLLTPLARLEQALSADLPDGDARGELARRLEALLSRVNDGTSTTTAVDATVLASASDEEMFALIDRELSA
ncbi:phosphopantetheine-binding protein [Phytohabitans houttuyneae]|nr:phosphopantetheine-binding protein [Phytohabitans houttuyneae]